MANTAPLATPTLRTQRPRPGAVAALLLFAVLAAMAVFGLDWRESPAMLLGELIGLISPLAVVGLAVLLIYLSWRRVSQP